jgi:hypothetical protein
MWFSETCNAVPTACVWGCWVGFGRSGRDATRLIDSTRVAYSAVGVRGAVLFLAGTALSRVLPAYQLSFGRFLNLFRHALQRAPPSRATEQRWGPAAARASRLRIPGCAQAPAAPFAPTCFLSAHMRSQRRPSSQMPHLPANCVRAPLTHLPHHRVALLKDYATADVTTAVSRGVFSEHRPMYALLTAVHLGMVPSESASSPAASSPVSPEEAQALLALPHA